MEKKIIIIAGEPSGDLQASLLIAKIKELEPQMQVAAMGGNFLRRAGARVFRDIQDLSVLGFFDVLKKIGKFTQLMRTVLAKIEEVKPDAVILVDFSGFNLRLAKKINKRFKTIYYISPQVWASRRGRVKTIKKYIDKMLVIFEFEKEFYAQFGIEAEFVGHPLLDIVRPSMNKNDFFKSFSLRENAPVFSLLPGSRIAEIKNILPIMLESAKLIQEKIPAAQFIISQPENIAKNVYEILLNRCALKVKIIDAKQYDCLNAADFVLTASGTATLETAIMRKPNVIIYKMGLLNYLLYRPQVILPFIGMENIVAGKILAPEFIQFRARPRLIANKVLEIFKNKELMETLRGDFADLGLKLGLPQAPLRAAKSILALINSASENKLCCEPPP